MSHRMQVLVNELEIERFRRIAERKRTTLSEWVRQTLLAAADQEPIGDIHRKLTAIGDAARSAFPVASIDDMLTEIEKGYHEEDVA